MLVRIIFIIIFSVFSVSAKTGLAQNTEIKKTTTPKHCLEYELGGKFFLGTGGLYSIEFGEIFSIGAGIGVSIEPNFYGSSESYISLPFFATILARSKTKLCPILEISSTFVNSNLSLYSLGAGFRRNILNKYFKTQVQMLYVDERNSSFMTFWLGLGLGFKI